MKQNNCQNCSHFYITHERNFRYGCRAFTIKSKIIPYLEIKKVSGTNCALFSKKEFSVKIKNKGRIA